MKLRRFFCLFLMLSFVSIAFTQFIEENELVLYVKDMKRISVKNPKRIAVGNPEVADVSTVTESEISIIGKTPGETTLVYWDDFGEHTVNLIVYPEDMSKIKRRIDVILEKLDLERTVTTKAMDPEGKVFLLGELKNVHQKERLMKALGELKSKIVDLTEVRKNQSSIEIEVQVLELKTGAMKNLGFNWAQSIKITELNEWSDNLSSLPKAIFKLTEWTRERLSATLDLLVQEGKARILSRPKLVCRSGREAELLVGGEVPILTTQAVSGLSGNMSTQVEYKEYGIKLKIKPTVIDENKIDLALNVEVSDILRAQAEILGSSSAPTAKAYPITRRNISTQLTIKDGQTLFIGGLMKEKTEEDFQKYPWLGDIPVLGAFFRHRSFSQGDGTTKGNTELFITLTPKILRDKKRATYHPASLSPEDVLKDYIRILQRRIRREVASVWRLLDLGWKANLIVKLKITSDGTLKDARIIKPSGYKILDEETLKVIKNLFYPPFPPELRLEEIMIELPIFYGEKE